MTVDVILAPLPAPPQWKLCSKAMAWFPVSRMSQTQEQHRDADSLILFTNVTGACSASFRGVKQF